MILKYYITILYIDLDDKKLYIMSIIALDVQELLLYIWFVYLGFLVVPLQSGIMVQAYELFLTILCFQYISLLFFILITIRENVFLLSTILVIWTAGLYF